MNNLNQSTKRTVAFYIRSAVKGSGGLIQEALLYGFLNGEKSHPLYHARTKTFVDDGFSGMNLDRPALQSLLLAVKAKEVDAVVVVDLSRLSRSPLGVLEILSCLKNLECELWEVSTGSKINLSAVTREVDLSGVIREVDLVIGGGQ